MDEGFEYNRRSIKYYVRNYLLANREQFARKKVIDLPAGNGVTSKILLEIGADPIPFDLFPEYFKLEGTECKRADAMKTLPLDDHFADALICQEGIEHLPDQLKVLRNFNRVLKPGGTLLITTPNYSNLSSKLSCFLSESERFNSIMPPNEMDSIWMSDQAISEEIYYGHIFLIGIQKLRLLAILAGFRIKRIVPARIKYSSLVLFLFFYPFILLVNSLVYYKNLRKIKGKNQRTRATYREVFCISIRPRVLLDSHLIVEFEKVSENSQIKDQLKGQHTHFGTT